MSVYNAIELNTIPSQPNTTPTVCIKSHENLENNVLCYPNEEYYVIVFRFEMYDLLARVICFDRKIVLLTRTKTIIKHVYDKNMY